MKKLTVTDPGSLLPVVMERELSHMEWTSLQHFLSRSDVDRMEEENQRGAALAERIAAGECAIVGRTCLTHNVTDDPGHAFDTGRLGSLD